MKKTTEQVIMPTRINQLLPVINLAKYEELGFGGWGLADGQANRILYDGMEKGYSKPNEPQKKLLSFAVITDIHITDKESPLQTIGLGLNTAFLSAYSPVSLYSTQVLAATIDTVNELNKIEPLDFLISLGDNCNNSQYNELIWFIDVLNGNNPIRPSSGEHIGEELIDYQKPFNSPGLDIPWYQVIGNHDQFWSGVFQVDEKAEKTLIGDTIVSLAPNIMQTGDPSKGGYYMGVFDCLTPEGKIVGYGSDLKISAPKVFPDNQRHSLVTKESINSSFMSEIISHGPLKSQITSKTPCPTKPSGHGFSNKNYYQAQEDFTCYSFYPNANLPIKIIVMDDTNPAGKTTDDIWVHGHGALDKRRLDFLKSELEDGQAKNELMLVMAHIPILTETVGSASGWWAHSEISEREVVELLHQYTNFIGWIAGHNHRNCVAIAPHMEKERSFWCVENPSLRDFPQQFREIVLFYNIDGTLSLTATSIDYDTVNYPVAKKSRCAAIASAQMLNLDLDSRNDNVELLCTLTTEMQEKLNKIL